jgi:translation machinery-associated protein 16
MGIVQQIMFPRIQDACRLRGDAPESGDWFLRTPSISSNFSQNSTSGSRDQPVNGHRNFTDKMPSKLAKVQKHVHKKKGSKINSLHENSRDAMRIRRAGARDDRVARMAAVREKANRTWLERVAFFRDRLPETLHPLDLDQMKSLVLEFLTRHDEELEQLKAERRPGRPPATRQTALEQQIEVEKKEFESGFWVPNLQDEETLQKLDGWKGDWLSLAVMRFVRVDEKGVLRESQFPPRGAS